MKCTLRFTISCALILAPLTVTAGPDVEAVCRALLDEEHGQLADDALDVELAQSSLAAFERLVELVGALWDRQATTRMQWLEAHHDRDAARLTLERARLILARQEAHVSRLELACTDSGDDRTRNIDAARRRYLEADCEQQAKAVDIAKVNLEFSREFLASILELRQGATGTATVQEEILARLDVTLEEQRLADAEARSQACRKRLAPRP